MEKVQVIEEKLPMKDYFGLSVVALFFCPLFGILAVWKSLKTGDQLRKGDKWSAELASLDALKWSMTGIVLGGAIYFITILLVVYWLVVYRFGDEGSPFIDLTLTLPPK